MLSLHTLVFLVCWLLAAPPALAVDAEKETESPKKHIEIHLDEVLVTVPTLQPLAGAAAPVTILKGEELRLKAGNSIGETLKLEPGIHSQSFGPGVGRPVIRGQSGPRVRILSNGLGNNDVSPISPDHASSVVPLLADRIEVLRGPATLMYGSGAIGGVVNVIDNRIPDQVPDKLIGGALEQQFDSISDETTTAMKIEGGQNHLAYHFDGFYRDRGNVDIGGPAIDITRAQVSEPGLNVTQNTRGFLRNSASDATGGSAGFSLVGEAGFVGISGNRLKNNYGIPPDGTDDGEIVRIALEQNKFDLKSEWFSPLSFLESIRMRLSYTDYEHREMAEGETQGRFTNDTYEGRLEVPHTPFGPLQGVVGFQATASKFSAQDIESDVAFVPRSHLHNYGVFAQESFDLGPVNTQLGVRVEHASVNPQDRINPYRSFIPVSASAAGLWTIDDQNRLNLALTRSQRAPQVQELFFQGFHEATRAFERGNANLEMETSYHLDLGYHYTSDWVTAELDLFHNWIDDYIFPQRNGQFIDNAPVVETRQGRATFMGYEAKLIFPLMNNLSGLIDLTLFSDFTRGRLVNRGNVPQQAPLRWGFQLDYIRGAWSSNLRLTRGEIQQHPGDNEAKTPDYVLLNLSTHYHFADVQGAEVMVFVKGNNLLDETIRNATSFLRNFAPEPGRGGVVGLRIQY